LVSRNYTLLYLEAKKKREVILPMLSMSRKVYLVMRDINLPSEMKWKIVMEEAKEKLRFEEKKKVVLFGSDERSLGKSEREFWEDIEV